MVTAWRDRMARVCKPNSVFPDCLRTRKRQPFIWALDCSLALATYPGGSRRNTDGKKRAASPSPVWSCSGWGLSCPFGYPRGGELLPRLFTLSRHIMTGGMFSVTLSVPGTLRCQDPRCSRGTLLCGVRTFLIPQAGRGCPTRAKAVVATTLSFGPESSDCRH